MVHMMRKNVYTLLRMNVKEAKVNYSVVFPGRVSPQLNYKDIPGIIVIEYLILYLFFFK